MAGLMLDFVNRQQDTIIENWITELENEYPGFYVLPQLRKHGVVYFNFIMDTHIPVEQHPFFGQMSQWCAILFHKNVPVAHTLHSSHLFRQSVIDAIERAPLELERNSGIISLLSRRIDAYERAVCNFYWQNARSIIEEKDRKLDELHEDKLNLIGKMAASMAHEIRNPLTSIKGFIKLIRSNLPRESLGKVERYINIIEGEFQNIQMQITGFLTFSKKPVIEEQFERISIEHILESVLLLVNPRLINENIELSVEIQRDLHLYVQRVPIQQVLSNLLNNSIDALSEITDTKKITIVTEENEQYVYLKVANNGPEIPEDMQKALFKPFVTSKMDGTGIGLAICKQIMSKNKGDISFTSNRHETVFILVFENSALCAVL